EHLVLNPLIATHKARLINPQIGRNTSLFQQALKNCDDDDLNQRIRTVVARHIGSAEKAVVAQLYTEALTFPFSRLLPLQIVEQRSSLPITTGSSNLQPSLQDSV
ncbi:MAG: hypothetical protein ACRYFU_01385, partial [Janthinobacterium lividum]